MLDVGADMSDDLPPPYTAVDETKFNQLTLTEQQLSGTVSYYPQHGQPLPPHLIPAYPSAPPGYETAVVYYPAVPNFADATVRLQPQPQSQPQVITIHQQPAQQSDDTELSNTRSTDVCLLCCMCLCCSCPCVLVSFM